MSGVQDQSGRVGTLSIAKTPYLLFPLDFSRRSRMWCQDVTRADFFSCGGCVMAGCSVSSARSRYSTLHYTQLISDLRSRMREFRTSGSVGAQRSNPLGQSAGRHHKLYLIDVETFGLQAVYFTADSSLSRIAVSYTFRACRNIHNMSRDLIPNL